MKVHNYHPETGEYLGSEQAEKSPREKGVYLVPANATVEKLPKVGDNEAAVFDGIAWQVRPDHRGTAYWLQDGTRKTIDQIGEPVPEGATTEPPIEQQRATVDRQRRSRYQAEVDPLMSEAQIKIAMGLAIEAEELAAEAIKRRTDIQAELPWPTAENAE